MIKLSYCLFIAVIYILSIATIDCLHCDGVAGVTSSNRINMCSDKNYTSRIVYLSSGPATLDCLCRVTFWRKSSTARSRVDVRNVAQVNSTCDDRIVFKSNTLVQCSGGNTWFWFPVNDGMSFHFIRRVGVKNDNNNMSFCLQISGVPDSLLSASCWNPVDASKPSGQTPPTTITKKPPTGAATGNTADDDSSSSVGAIVGAVVGVLVIVAAVIVFYILKIKKQKVEAE